MISGVLFPMACFAASKASLCGLLLFAAGRVVGGFGAGAATVLVPLYLGRIAPLKLRGAIGNLHQASKDSRNSAARLATGIAFYISESHGMIWNVAYNHWTVLGMKVWIRLCAHLGGKV